VRREFFRPLGLLGTAVTIGLLAYELFGIKKCHELIRAGKDLECNLVGLPVDDRNTPAGQFLRRPDHVLRFVNEPFAAAAIYPAVLAAWIYLAFFAEDAQRGKNIGLGIFSVLVFLVGFVGIVLYDQHLKREDPKSPCEADDHAATHDAPVHEKARLIERN
jgi:hypothetical protein